MSRHENSPAGGPHLGLVALAAACAMRSALRGFVDPGSSLAIPLTKTYSFDALPEALGLVGKRRSRGKVAIAIA